MAPPPRALVVAAIGLIADGQRLLMVESDYPNVPGTFWAMPGGMLEDDETVEDGLTREVAEETGIHVGGPVTVTAVIWLVTDAGSPDWVTFVCEPSTWSGTLAPHDPDGATIVAAFVDRADAVRRIRAQPWGLGEPIVQRVLGAPPGASWIYRWNGNSPWEGNGPAQLISGP